MSDLESLSTLDEINIELEQPVEFKRPYFFQLDALKAIAIAFVVMDHSLTWEIKGAMGSVLWERLSIPFFLLVMGFNSAYSFKYSGAETLRELYSKDYFKRKIIRYVLPFTVLFAGSSIVGIATGIGTVNEYTLLGILPFWGPGNWFISLLLGSILVLPFIYWLFTKQPRLTLVLCFLGEIALQAIMYIWFPYPLDSPFAEFIVTAIRLNVIFFLPAIGLGIWFSRDYTLSSRWNWFMIIYIPISYIFIFDYMTGILSSMPNIFGYSISWIQEFIRGDYTLLFYGYAALMFLTVMESLPQDAHGSLQRFVQRVGKASYHILLFQIFYMSILYYTISIDASIQHQIPDFAAILGWPSVFLYIPFYFINLVVCITGGLLWYEVEKKVSLKRKSS